jgi:hypothetical protein
MSNVEYCPSGFSCSTNVLLLVMKKFILTAALLTVCTSVHAQEVDSLPDDFVGHWCMADLTGAWAINVKGNCVSQKGDGSFDLTKNSYIQKHELNHVCTFDKIERLGDNHYLIEETCKSDPIDNGREYSSGEPYQTSETIFQLDSCGRLRTRIPDLCDPRSDEPPDTCDVSDNHIQLPPGYTSAWIDRGSGLDRPTIYDAPGWLTRSKSWIRRLIIKSYRSFGALPTTFCATFSNAANSPT